MSGSASHTGATIALRHHNGVLLHYRAPGASDSYRWEAVRHESGCRRSLGVWDDASVAVAAFRRDVENYSPAGLK